MIPDKVVGYMKAENFYGPREDKEDVLNVLDSLNIDHSSDFAQYYIETYGLLISPKPIADLLDIDMIASQISYILERYDLPSEFIALTSDESEGMYLYNAKNQKVYDFELAHYTDFVERKIEPRWETFNEFLLWFVDEQNLDDV